MNKGDYKMPYPKKEKRRAIKEQDKAIKKNNLKVKRAELKGPQKKKKN